MTRPTPHTLEAWLKLLDSVSLPVPRHSYERVQAALADNRSSLRDIAEAMQQSPALVLSMMRAANLHNNEHNLAEPAESLEIALNRLGLKRAEELLARLPALDQAEIPHGLRQLQMISQHATQQANGLFGNRLARLWQEIHWGSLLFLAPLWPLAMTHPQLLEEWELRVIHKGESARTVELELFGVRLLRLCLTMAEHWHLPAWVRHGYRLLLSERRLLVRVLHIARDDQDALRQQRRMDEDPNLRRWLNQPANTVLLANGLALAAQQAWECPHMTRWQYLAALYLQVPMPDLQQQVHQQAVQSAQQHAGPDLFHPAEALIWPWSERRVHRGLLPAAAPSAESLVEWRKFCADLLVEPSRFNNPLHLTTYARDALVACGLQRVIMLMAENDGSALRTHQSAGLPSDLAILNLPVSHSTLLQRLLAKPAQIRITPENNAQFSALIPTSLRRLFKGDHLLMRSLSSNGRVIMLVVADQGGGPLSEITVQAFGKTAQCIERAFNGFSQRGG